MRKPAFCICENKDADADRRLCFRYTDKSEIPNLLPYSVTVQSGLSRTWSDTPEGRFSHNEAQVEVRPRRYHEGV